MIMEKVSEKSNCLDPLVPDVRAVQDWEQGRRVPDRAARVLLTVIDRDPEAVVRALGDNPNGQFAAK